MPFTPVVYVPVPMWSKDIFGRLVVRRGHGSCSTDDGDDVLTRPETRRLPRRPTALRYDCHGSSICSAELSLAVLSTVENVTDSCCCCWCSDVAEYVSLVAEVSLHQSSEPDRHIAAADTAARCQMTR